MANTLKLGAGKWATGTDTVLAFNDENNNFKPLPFEFSRASSATVVNQSGLIETVGSGTPRIDFLGNTKGALLLEPTRTNLITQSEAFNNSYWTKLGTSFTVTPNNVISPNGELNASTINVTNNDNILYRSMSGLSSSVSSWTFSIYAKGSGTFDMNIRLNSSTTDTQTKTLTSEWQRFNVTATRTPTINSIESYIELNTSSTYQIWGAQVEESYPTSYIPTSGSAVTRVAETCSQTPPDGVIGQTEGTIYADIEKISGNEFASWRFSISDNTNNNWIFFSLEDDFDLRVYVRKNGSTSNDSQINNKFFNDGVYKVALAYANNDVVVYINGSLAYSSTSASIPSTTEFIITGNSSATTSAQLKSGKIYQTKLYNTRLSNAELQALTTI